MNRSRRLLLLLSLGAIACGSGGLSSKAARLREGTDTELTDCSFLQKVSGSASDSDSKAQTTAKNAARESAASIGATHIKWIVPCCTYVEAEAYRCDAPEE
jgi:hypothetical protein